VHSWLSPVFYQAQSILETHKTVIKEPAHSLEYIFMLISVAIAVGAIYLARNFYSDEKWTKPRKLASGFKPAYSMLWNKYFLDNIYHSVIVNPLLFVSRTFLWKFFDARIIDGFVNGSAKVTTQAGEIVRKLQTGLAQNYALLMLAGIIIIIALMAFAV
jgi:NADH-quinone oxidoreductase subunit L